MTFAFLTFCARRTVSILAMSSIAILGAVLGQSDVSAAERPNPGWLVSVNGKSIVTPSFPGSEHFSFISFPASSVASPNLSDHLIGQDDSLSLVLFSPNPALSIGAIGRYDPNRSTFDSFAGLNKNGRWSQVYLPNIGRALTSCAFAVSFEWGSRRGWYDRRSGGRFRPTDRQICDLGWSSCRLERHRLYKCPLWRCRNELHSQARQLAREASAHRVMLNLRRAGIGRPHFTPITTA